LIWSRVLRAACCSIVASTLFTGYYAWVDPPNFITAGGYYRSLVGTACFTFWCAFVVLGAVFWPRGSAFQEYALREKEKDQ